LLLSLVTVAVFSLFATTWLSPEALANPVWFIVVLVWLFTTILLSAMAIVRHAESIAVKLGEPLGTLVLTLSVIGIEVMMISAVMSSGDGNVTLARDAMFAVVMIVCNAMVGVCLLVGGLRYHEQTYNLQGANAFLAVLIPLAVLGLVLPNFTQSSPGPTFSPLHSGFLMVMSVGLYGVFLAIQTSRHRQYFIAPDGSPDEAHAEHHHPVHSLWFHAPLLVAYLAPVVLLAKKIAVPIDFGIHVLHAPAALGGLIVSVLVLFAESISATRAALKNNLQRSVNLLLGSALASISLTIPAALGVGFLINQQIVLGLDAADMTLLLLTFAVSMLTFASPRTNVLQGAVHLLLFLAYLMLIFEK